ncbi:hypothetical protein RugamoR57_22750 [Duganella caerulea]|uniref:hypothetical protein n=1 Tax=Duganella caerulea TaxID=2885762 RepID=UPI0030E93387
MARAGTAFPAKGLATAWVATTESNMLAMKHEDVRIITKMTLADLIDKYTEGIGGIKHHRHRPHLARQRPEGRQKTNITNVTIGYFIIVLLC